MPEQSLPNIGVSLFAIHHVITRALDVSIRNCSRFLEEGFASDQLKNGYCNYVRSLATVLRAHHLTEDEAALPALESLMKNVPFSEMRDEHVVLEPLIPELQKLVTRLESDPDPKQALQELHDALHVISQLWHPHIAKEERYFTLEALQPLFPPEEHVRLITVFTEVSKKYSQPDYLIMPFVLFNLEEKERAAFASKLPPVILQQLIPSWKQKWESMAPFLLL